MKLQLQQSLMMEDPKKREAEQIIIDNGLSRQNLEVGKSASRAKSLKIASGLRKILTRNCKKQVTTAERKAQSEKISFTDRQIAWIIYDFFKIGDDNEAISDFRDLSKVQLKNDSVQAFDTKWDEILSAVTDRPTDNILESLYKMQVKSRRS